MSETVNMEFTREEWNALRQVIRRHARTTGENDLAEQKQKIQAKLNSCQMELNRLSQDEAETKTFLSIIDKIERKL
jgi:hypothetical protein